MWLTWCTIGGRNHALNNRTNQYCPTTLQQASVFSATHFHYTFNFHYILNLISYNVDIQLLCLKYKYFTLSYLWNHEKYHIYVHATIFPLLFYHLTRRTSFDLLVPAMLISLWSWLTCGLWNKFQHSEDLGYKRWLLGLCCIEVYLVDSHRNANKVSTVEILFISIILLL